MTELEKFEQLVPSIYKAGDQAREIVAKIEKRIEEIGITVPVSNIDIDGNGLSIHRYKIRCHHNDYESNFMESPQYVRLKTFKYLIPLLQKLNEEASSLVEAHNQIVGEIESMAKEILGREK